VAVVDEPGQGGLNDRRVVLTIYDNEKADCVSRPKQNRAARG
jgi:hypothetical protein